MKIDMSTWWGFDDELRYGLEDMVIIGNPSFAVGIPWDSNEQLIKRVFAAVVSCALGHKSVDHTLKRYGDSWPAPLDPRQVPLRERLSCVKMIVSSGLEYFMSITDKSSRPGLFAATAALFRLQNTFKAASLAITQGLHFEAAALERMILEQLAWVFTIQRHEDDFFQVKPQSCVGRLRVLFPTAGSMYGLLSGQCHISPETTLEYVKLLEDGELAVRLVDPRLTNLDACLLIGLADMFCVVGEYIYADLIDDYRYLVWENGNLRPDKNRPTQAKKEEFYRRLSPSAPAP